MNKIYNLFFVLIAVFAVSCSKSDDNNVEPLRDYTEQYAKDLDSIDEFIDTHYMTVSPDLDVTFTAIPTGGTQASIRNQDQYPLQFKMIDVEEHGVNYKVYYIDFREGVNKNPTMSDSIHVSYTGNLISLSQFDQALTPIWIPLDNTIRGWREIIPMFKTGVYDTSGGPNPVTFTDYGAGAMFLPSGLSYYSQATTGVPKYSPLIFSFKLMELRYRDHDRDGILSKEEVTTAGSDPTDLDTDADGAPNYLDVDDDGDGILTKFEIHKNGTGEIIFEDCDSDGVPNYLDADDNGSSCN
jgi:FKBP-type peptidyl-prolyl cis-trans isomerase FkpA